MRTALLILRNVFAELSTKLKAALLMVFRLYFIAELFLDEAQVLMAASLPHDVAELLEQAKCLLQIALSRYYNFLLGFL